MAIESETKPPNIFKRDKKTGYGPTSAILVTLGIYFGAQILAVIAIGFYAAFKQADRDVTSSLIENSIPAQFVFILLIEVLSVYLLWLFIGRRRIKWRDIGLKKPKAEHLLYALPVYAVYFVLALLAVGAIKALLPGLDIDQEQQIGFEGAAGSLELTLVLVSLVIMPALVEEILVRGFLYGGLIKKFSKWVAALVASGIFAVAHLQFGSGEPLLWVAAIDTFILSMMLIWLREKTGNIWSGVIVHMIKNGIAFVGLFVLKLS